MCYDFFRFRAERFTRECFSECIAKLHRHLWFVPSTLKLCGMSLWRVRETRLVGAVVHQHIYTKRGRADNGARQLSRHRDPYTPQTKAVL